MRSGHKGHGLRTRLFNTTRRTYTNNEGSPTPYKGNTTPPTVSSAASNHATSGRVLEQWRSSVANESVYTSKIGIKDYLAYLHKTKAIFSLPRTFIIGLPLFGVPLGYNLWRVTHSIEQREAALIEHLSLSSTLYYTNVFAIASTIFASAAGVVWGALRTAMQYGKFVESVRWGIPHTRPFFKYIQTGRRNLSITMGLLTGVLSGVFTFSTFTGQYYLQLAFPKYVQSLNASRFTRSDNVPTEAQSQLWAAAQAVVIGGTLLVVTSLCPFVIVPWAVGILEGAVVTQWFSGANPSRNLSNWKMAHTTCPLLPTTPIVKYTDLNAHEQKKEESAHPHH